MSQDAEYDRMLAGQLYITEKIHAEHREWPGKLLVQQINALPADQLDEITRLEAQIFGASDVYVQPPFEVDYGTHIKVGKNFYCNVDAVFLDTNWITIGNNVKIGPRVNLLTAGHPIDASVRVSMLEFAQPITIGDNTWLGGNVTVLPGVSIGSNSVVGAGSVVVHDLPDNVVAAGADKVHGSGIEVKKSGSIANLADLKGKRIAYTKGTSSQYMVLMALQEAALTTKDVTLVDMDQNAAAVAFAKGTIDAWATWDPYSATAEVTGGAKLLVDDTGLAKNRDYLLSTRKFAGKHKALSQTLTKALSADMTWANENQAALSKMLVKTLKLNAKVVNKMLDRRSFSMGAVTQANIKEQQAIADEFYAQKLVSKHVTISDYVIK